jgi:hypothetical protein
MTPALAAAYEAVRGTSSTRAPFVAMVTIAPRPRSIIPGRNDLHVRNVEVRFDSMTSCHSSSVMSCSAVNRPKPPANATRTSGAPSSASTWERIRSICARSVTSVLMPTASPPAWRRPETTPSIPCRSRATTATLTPFAASTRHVAAPIPFEPPVTTATWPARSG